MAICLRNIGSARGLVALLVLMVLASIPVFQSSVFSMAGAAGPKRRRQNDDNRFSRDTRISSVVAVSSKQGVLIRWKTSFEIDNVGFNVYREREGQRVRVNREIILGSAFIVGQSVPLRAGYSYSWFDANGTPDSFYLIEAIALDGAIKASDKIAPEWKDRIEVEGELVDSNKLSSSRPAGIQKEYPTESAPPPRTEGPIEDQWAIVSQPGLKISIKKDGWYRVSQQQIAAAGFNPVVDIGNLRLFKGAGELAILTNRSSGQFVNGDSIEFYGQGVDTPTTDTNIYYLVAGTTAGKRIGTGGKRIRGQARSEAERLPSPFPESSLLPSIRFNPRVWFWWLTFLIEEPAPTATATAPTRAQNAERQSVVTTPARPLTKRITRKGKKRRQLKRQYAHALARPTAAAAALRFDHTVERKERSVYFVSLINGDAENHFGSVLSSSPVEQVLTTFNPETNGGGTARLEIALQGASAGNHVVNIQVNGVAAGTMTLVGLEHKVQNIDIPVSQLQNGNNTVKLVPSVGTGLSLFDYMRVTYPHSYRADGGSLRFSLGASQSARIDGFTTSGIRLIDYTDPFAVRVTKPLVEANDNGFTVQVPSVTTSRLMYAIPNGEADQPASLSLNQPSSLNLNSNGSDLLIIAHSSLLPSVAPLANLRRSQGMDVSVVDVEDIYDEFSYGSHGPQGIKNFLVWASAHWTKAPRYVVLAGDASSDPRDYLGFGNFDLLPTKLVDATYSETASDDWLSDFNDDGAADIPVGRLPVRVAEEANLVISKIVNFSPANTPPSALLVADAQGSYYFNFEQANTEVQSLLPTGMTALRVDRRLEPSDAQARANIIAKFNSGQALVNYSGHGNVDTWTGGSIFTSSDAAALTNGSKLPFVVVMDCLNGYFQDPHLQGLAETLMRASNGGAVAAFASSGSTLPDGQHAMSAQLYKSLYGTQSIALGDAIKTAKSATFDVDVRRTWIFFGDPSIKIR